MYAKKIFNLLKQNYSCSFVLHETEHHELRHTIDEILRASFKTQCCGLRRLRDRVVQTPSHSHDKRGICSVTYNDHSEIYLHSYCRVLNIR